MSRMRIKNWSQFQHFRDRCPPWIKLYRELLDDPDWHKLDGELAKTLVMLWLVASEDCGKEGRLPEIRRLAFRLRMDEQKLRVHIQRLDHWLIQDDIETISDRYHDDAPEAEAKGEEETEYCATSRTIHENVTDEEPESASVDDAGPVARSKKGKTLKGEILEAFGEFWEAFGDKRGKAEAADAFLAVYRSELHEQIIAGARQYAEARQLLINKGQTPKMAQGWLSGRRWEDESPPYAIPKIADHMLGVQ